MQRERERGESEKEREREREMHSIDTLSHPHKYLNFVTIPIDSQLKRFT